MPECFFCSSLIFSYFCKVFSNENDNENENENEKRNTINDKEGR